MKLFCKENKCFLYIGLALGFLGIWDILKMIVKTLNSGFYPWIPKIVCILILIYACFVYVQEKKKSAENKPDPRALEIPENLDFSDNSDEQ